MIDVTCAVIRNEDDEILVVQRGEGTDHPFKWEFPGGKVDPGETEDDCIIREIREELSIDIVICGRLPDVEYDYGFRKIRLIPFVCDTLDDDPRLSEHIAFRWTGADKLLTVDFAEADVPVAESYLSTVKAKSSGMKNVTVIKEQSKGAVVNDQIDEAQVQAMVNTLMGVREADWLAVSAAENPALFEKLLEYSWSDDRKLAFKASWTLTKVCDKEPELIYPYMPQIVENLEKMENESALRSFLRIISLSDPGKLDSGHQGILAEACFRLLNSGVSAIAVKAYTMEILYKLALIHPGFAIELAASIQNMLDEGSAGIVARGRMILKKLDIEH